MSIVTESNERIAAAQRRMLSRQARIRADVLMLKHAWGAMLTQPLAIGGALVGGLMLGRRGRTVTAPVECKCKTQKPSLLRTLARALLVPMISQWMDAARKQPAATGGSVSGAVERAAVAEGAVQA